MCPRAVAVLLILSSTFVSVCDAILAPIPPAPYPGGQFSTFEFCSDEAAAGEAECQTEASFEDCVASSALCDLLMAAVRVAQDCPPEFSCPFARPRDSELVKEGKEFCGNRLPYSCIGTSIKESQKATEIYEQCLTSFLECGGRVQSIIVDKAGCETACDLGSSSLLDAEGACDLETECYASPPANFTCPDGSSPEKWICERISSGNCDLVPVCPKSIGCEDLDESSCGKETECQKIFGYSPLDACYTDDVLAKLPGKIVEKVSKNVLYSDRVFGCI